MNIRDRLSQLARYRSTHPRYDRPRHRREEMERPLLQDLLPGEEMVNEKGCFFCARHFHPGSLRHGYYVLRDCIPIDTSILSILTGDPGLVEFDLQDGVFLDTETTGLAGGTGTLPFLIGLGWFEEKGFVIHQLFVRDYDEEKAALHHFIEYLGKKKFLITFNGKAFDANLLNARLILNRLPPLLEGMPHADLLHPARRLFRHRLNDRSLPILEETILGLTREGDVPGSEIPFLYFDWLRKRDARLMVRVFEHNRLDILSLVTLTAKLTALVDPEAMTPEAEPGDKLAAGRIWANRGMFNHAIPILESIRNCNCDTQIWCTVSRELSLIYRRLGRWKEATSIWEQMIQRDPSDVFALLELAKYYEHRASNPEVALSFALHAKKASPHVREIDHRIERLLKRISPR